MAVVGKVTVDLKPVKEILRRKGLEPAGDVQQFHTQNVLKRLVRYMPYRTGATIKLTQAQSPLSGNAVNLFTPYGRYLHEGKVMVNSKTGKGPPVIPDVGPRWRKGTELIATDRPLTYTTTNNPKAGPRWGHRLAAAEGAEMLDDLKKYVQGRSDT